nr:hypothetical protein [Tanacetum cinerariifolium]
VKDPKSKDLSSGIRALDTKSWKQRSIFKERDFDVQAMMDADYELAARLRAEEQR